MTCMMGGMEPFEVSGQITINLPAQQVFPLATNLTNPWWQVTQQKYGQTKPVVSHTSGPKMGVGAVYTSIGQQTSDPLPSISPPSEPGVIYGATAKVTPLGGEAPSL